MRCTPLLPPLRIPTFENCPHLRLHFLPACWYTHHATKIIEMLYARRAEGTLTFEVCKLQACKEEYHASGKVRRA